MSDSELTREEVAQLAGVSPVTVASWVRRGVLPSIQEEPYGRRTFQRGDVLEFIRSREAEQRTWVTFVVASEVIGCTVTVVRKAVAAGEIRRRTDGVKKPALLRSDVEAFAASWEPGRRNRPHERTQAPSEGEWVLRPEAAQLLGVTEPHLERLVASSRLMAVRRGRRMWIRRDSLESARADWQRPEATAFEDVHSTPAAATRAGASGDRGVMSRRFATLEEAGKRLEVSRRQVYDLVRRGELPALKLGRRGAWRVELSVLDAYAAHSPERRTRT